jgi:hypothetical protein
MCRSWELFQLHESHSVESGNPSVYVVVFGFACRERAGESRVESSKKRTNEGVQLLVDYIAHYHDYHFRFDAINPWLGLRWKLHKQLRSFHSVACFYAKLLFMGLLSHFICHGRFKDYFVPEKKFHKKDYRSKS